MTVEAFMASARPTTQNFVSSNTAFGINAAKEYRDVVSAAARRAPRNNQKWLGPSEIGVPCHRQVAGKFAGLPHINHVADPWPAILGTAGHAWLAEVFGNHESQNFLAERRVVPVPGHSGTADLYDAKRRAVVDWKILGPTSQDKLKSKGAPRGYFIQLLAYGLGYLRLGLPVDRVMIASWRRSGTLQDLYVWDHELTAYDYGVLEYIFNEELPYRKGLAKLLEAGEPLANIPVGDFDGEKPECYFCPFFAPDGQHGDKACPGLDSENPQA